MTARPIRAGDHVLHRPSGETWVVCYADDARNDLSAYGWPETLARLTDCELVYSCTDEEHERSGREWAAKPSGDDHRPAAVRRLYGAAFGLALALLLLGCSPAAQYEVEQRESLKADADRCRALCELGSMRVASWIPGATESCICAPAPDGGAP